MNKPQYMYGGKSTRWQYTTTMQYLYGPRYNGDVTYRCARNISGSSDNYCDNYSDNADGPDALSVVASPGLTSTQSMSFNKSFGTAVKSKKYGQLKPIVRWLDYNTVVRGDDGDYGFKFRMWDAQRFTSSDSHMLPVTGNGS